METRRVVDFDQPWLELLVQEDIKAENLKAGTAPSVVGEAGSVIVFQDWMSCDQSLDNHILQYTILIVILVAFLCQPACWNAHFNVIPDFLKVVSMI